MSFNDFIHIGMYSGAFFLLIAGVIWWLAGLIDFMSGLGRWQEDGSKKLRQSRQFRNAETRRNMQSALDGLALCGDDKAEKPVEAPADKKPKQDPAERRMEALVARAVKKMRVSFDELDEFIDRIIVTYGTNDEGQLAIVLGEATSGFLCIYIASAEPKTDQCIFLTKQQLITVEESVSRQRRR